MNPNEYAPERAKLLKRWKRNRDHCDGVDAVKDAGETYLPRRKGENGLEDAALAADHKMLIQATEYFPAAAHTQRFYTGLVFRKPAKLTAPAQIEAMSSAITADGLSLESLSKWALREYGATNDGGILVDHPETPVGLSLAQAQAQDIRPYHAAYAAEAILELSYNVVGGRKRLHRVRLLESPTAVRYLEMIDGKYVVTVYEDHNGAWSITSQTTPTINGQAITSIPFVWLGDGEMGAAFDDLAALNGVHYIQSANLATALQWISAPVTIIKGVDRKEGDDPLVLRSGICWFIQGDNADAKWHEYGGDGVPAIERQLDRLEAHMAMIGSRMLATEKAAAEAAETVARRQAGENSILAAMARHISACVQSSLKIVAEWMMLNADDVSYVLSTDFIPTPIDPQTLSQVMALNQSGKLPDSALFEILQNGEILGEQWDYETWAALNDTSTLD